MTKVKVECANCNKIFKKTKSEFNRSVRRQRRHFCSKSCSASAGNKGVHRGTTKHLIKLNRIDNLTPFRYFLKIARNRKRTKEGQVCDLTLEYLKTLWDKQDGVCPYTGWKLNLPLTTAGFRQKRHPNNASLDRINCSNGYEIGNVRFVSLIYNVARNDFSEEDLIKFCKSVLRHCSVKIC